MMTKIRILRKRRIVTSLLMKGKVPIYVLKLKCLNQISQEIVKFRKDQVLKPFLKFNKISEKLLMNVMICVETLPANCRVKFKSWRLSLVLVCSKNEPSKQKQLSLQTKFITWATTYQIFSEPYMLKTNSAMHSNLKMKLPCCTHLKDVDLMRTILDFLKWISDYQMSH